MACWRLTTKNKTIHQGPRQKRGPFFVENVLLIIKKPFPKANPGTAFDRIGCIQFSCVSLRAAS